MLKFGAEQIAEGSEIFLRGRFIEGNADRSGIEATQVYARREMNVSTFPVSIRSVSKKSS
jgi:hypothetical protein